MYSSSDSVCVCVCVRGLSWLGSMKCTVIIGLPHVKDI